jgi:aminoglycoside 3-N-acetyltransferase I
MMSSTTTIRRLTTDDVDHARQLFAVMSRVFEEPCEPLSEEYLIRLLSRQEFWAFAAFRGGEIIGGLTAHTLPMTRSEVSEIFIYDIAVRAEHQRKGVGRKLIHAVLVGAATSGADTVIVPADKEDEHALEFYRAVGGTPSDVTFFTWRVEIS